MAGVLHPLIWPQLATVPLGTEGQGQGWSPSPAAAAAGPGWRQKVKPYFFKNLFLVSSPPALHPPLLPSCSAPPAASLPPAGPGRELPGCCRNPDEGQASNEKAKQEMALCTPGQPLCRAGMQQLWGPSSGHPVWPGVYGAGRGFLPALKPLLSSEQRLGVPREGASKASITHGVLRASLHPGMQQPSRFCHPCQLWHPGHHLPTWP